MANPVQNVGDIQRHLYKRTKWLRFFIVGKKPKTLILHVINTSNQFLGKIHWRGSFRKYAYQSEPHVDYDDRCLREIADVCEELTEAHKAKKKEQ